MDALVEGFAAAGPVGADARGRMAEDLQASACGAGFVHVHAGAPSRPSDTSAMRTPDLIVLPPSSAFSLFCRPLASGLFRFRPLLACAQAVQLSLDKIHRARPGRGKVYVDAYLKAFYYGEDDLVTKTRATPCSYAHKRHSRSS